MLVHAHGEAFFAGAPGDQGKTLAEGIEPIWQPIEGTVQENSQETYDAFEGAFTQLESGDATQAAEGARALAAAADAYLAKFPSARRTLGADPLTAAVLVGLVAACGDSSSSSGGDGGHDGSNSGGSTGAAASADVISRSAASSRTVTRVTSAAGAFTTWNSRRRPLNSSSVKSFTSASARSAFA